MCVCALVGDDRSEDQSTLDRVVAWHAATMPEYRMVLLPFCMISIVIDFAQGNNLPSTKASQGLVGNSCFALARVSFAHDRLACLCGANSSAIDV